MKKKIGLALSGGGARGFAHIGVLKVLVEKNIPVHMIAGTSAGSIVGGAFASGMAMDEIVSMARSIGWTDLGRPSLSPLGFFSNEPMGRFLERNFPVSSFEKFPIPFAAVACDLDTGEQVILKDAGDAIFAIRASCAVPGVFMPLVEDGRMLVDGGSVKPLPCDILREMGADIVIAVDVLSCGSSFRSRPRTALGVTIQSAMTLIRTASRNQHYLADIIVEPQIAHLRPDEIKKCDEFIELGAKAAIAKIEALSDATS